MSGFISSLLNGLGLSARFLYDLFEYGRIKGRSRYPLCINHKLLVQPYYKISLSFKGFSVRVRLQRGAEFFVFLKAVQQFHVFCLTSARDMCSGHQERFI
jgi:hypothetical protein